MDADVVSVCLIDWDVKHEHIETFGLNRIFSKTCIMFSKTELYYQTLLWDFATYRINEQQRLRRACANAQSHQSDLLAHT